MNKSIIFLAIGTMLLTGCSDTTSFKSYVDTYLLGKQEVVETKVADFEIVLFVDGTDKIHNEYAVPFVDMDFMTYLVNKIQQSGEGKLWLGYIDAESQNNRVAYIEIARGPRLIEITGKKRSETNTEFYERYNLETMKFKKDSTDFERSNSQKLSVFLKEVQEIIKIAYSDKVAKSKNGSDVNGAINSGTRLLNIINDSAAKQYIILVSDGVDNIGKPLSKVPDNVEVILVNNSGSKCRLETEVIELDNLTRMEEFIFSDK